MKTVIDTAPPPSLVEVFKALADESRLKAVGLLAHGERSVQALAGELGLKEPTVSHHLKVLREAGLVRARQDGVTRFYALDFDALAARARTLLSREDVKAMADEAPDERIVRNYLTEDGRLKVLPASRRKRRVVLAWLARQFDEGRTYTEAEINAAIERRHPDRETFRRELVGYRMLERQDGIYRRLPESDWTP